MLIRKNIKIKALDKGLWCVYTFSVISRCNMKKLISALQFQNSVEFDENYLLDLGGEGEDKAHIWGRLSREGQEYVLDYEGDALLSSTCDRCLEACQCSIHVDYCEQLDEETMEMGLEEIARQEFILQRPLQILCSQDCKGLCIHCGANLNKGACNCEAPVDPRLEKLLTLIKD